MKRIPAVIALTAALSFGVSAHAQTSFADVPAGHWAQEAIKRAVDCGIILGYPDGTFRGKQAITRYEAAAMIGRLLDAVASGKCGLPGSGAPVTMDQDALDALQNAVQELSADLADQGVRISELEDNAVSQDDLSRVEELATEARDLAQAAVDSAGGGDGASADDVAALQEQLDALQEQVDSAVSAEDFAALQDQVASVEELAQEARDLAEANSGSGDGTDPEALAALTDQVEAAGIAADTALAQSRDLQDSVDALNGRVDDLESQLGELGATVEGQADSIAALNDLVVLLNEDVLSLQDRVSALEGQLEDVNAQFEDINGQLEGVASADDLEALREFTTLLRRDQTALADRVSDLEARVGAAEKKNADQDARLDTLEANGFTVSGSISLTYYQAITYFGDGSGGAPDFDIDRLGISGAFSSGQDKDKDNAATTYADFFDGYGLGDLGDEGVAAGLAGVNGGGSSTLMSAVPGSRVRVEGKVSPGFSIKLAFKQRNLVEDSKGYNTFPLVLTLEGVTSTPFTADGSDSVNPLGFKLTALKAKYTVGGAPLTIDFGVNPGFKFAKYAGNNGDGAGDGIVATADAGFLGLKLTGVYISTNRADGNHNYLGGLKGDASLLPGLTGSVYWLRLDRDQLGPAKTAGITVLGASASGKLLGFLDLEGEFNSSATDFTDTRVAGYVKAGISLGAFTVGGNYRVINAGWADGVFAAGPLSYTGVGIGSDGPYKENQQGFGVEASINGLFNFLSVSGYFDSRTRVNSGSAMGNGPKSNTQGGATVDAEVDFGVVGGIRLIGFNVEGLFISEAESAGGTAVAAGVGTVVGARAVHDGKKDDALIKGLDLALGFGTGTGRYNGNGFFGYAGLSLPLGGIQADVAGYFTTGTNVDTALGGSLKLAVPFLLNSKLTAGAAIDQSKSVAGVAASTTWASVGLAFEQFLLPNSTFSAAFAFRDDVNRSGTGFGPSFGTFTNNNAITVFGDAAKGWGGIATGSGGTELGLYLTAGYYGLQFSYGIFTLDDDVIPGNSISVGQAFKIAYKLKF